MRRCGLFHPVGVVAIIDQFAPGRSALVRCHPFAFALAMSVWKLPIAVGSLVTFPSPSLLTGAGNRALPDTLQRADMEISRSAATAV